MATDAVRNAYRRDGFVVVPDLVGPRTLTELREIIAELVAGAAAVDTHNALYDLEPGHTYEVAAADAWPLLGVGDLDEFNRRLLSGRPTLSPRLASVPVRLPLPPAARQGSIYENQAGAARFYFDKTAV